MVITVIIRDISPVVHLNEPVGLRTARIELTKEQEEKLKLRSIGFINGVEMFEQYSICILEEVL